MKKSLIGIIFSSIFLISTNPIHASEDIILWTYDEPVFDQLKHSARAFKKDTGITVKVERKIHRFSDIERGVFKDDGPDLFIWSHDLIDTWVKKKLIEPVNIAPKLQAQMLPISIDGVTW